jgi:hypothetical protein
MKNTCKILIGKPEETRLKIHGGRWDNIKMDLAEIWREPVDLICWAVSCNHDTGIRLANRLFPPKRGLCSMEFGIFLSQIEMILSPSVDKMFA